jgi:triphosphatase
VLTMQSMIASRSWSIASPDTPLHTEEAEICARRTLNRLWKRARKRGKRFSNLGDEDRHRLRIAMKALRYGADFFSAIFQRPRRFQAFVDKVSALQDLLGTYNDNIATRKFLDTLGPMPVPGAAKHFVLGWYARDEKLAANQLPEAWKRFRKARPYWR